MEDITQIEKKPNWSTTPIGQKTSNSHISACGLVMFISKGVRKLSLKQMQATRSQPPVNITKKKEGAAV